MSEANGSVAASVAAEQPDDRERRPAAVSRRAVLAAGTLGLAMPLAIASGAPTGSAQEASPPSATPGATPVVGATPVAAVERIGPGGALEVVRDRLPVPAGPPVAGGTVRVVRPPLDRDDFNPVAFHPDPQVTLGYLEPLLRPNDETMEPEPWLATGWAWSNDGRRLTVTLRDDVRWHDGSPFTAADAVFSLVAYRDDPASAVRNLFAAIADATAVDDATLRIDLVEPDGNVPFNALTQPVFQRAQYADHWQAQPEGNRTLSGFDWDASPPLGTGPWRVTAAGRERVGLEPNGAYWGDGPYLDRLEVIWEEGAANRLAAWREEGTDLLWPLRIEEIARAGRRPGRLYAVDAASVMFAAFNFAHPTSAIPDIFADVRVRRALSLAIDRRRYAEEVFGGFIRFDAAGTVAQPWAYDDRLRAPRFDPSRASALLAEAGWFDNNADGVLENAGGIPFIVKVVLAAGSRPELPRVLARVKEDLLHVGVVLNIELLDEAGLTGQVTLLRDYDLIAYAYDLYPGFTDFDLYGSAWDVRNNPQGWNPGAYRNPDADEAIAAFLAATEVAAQREALRRLQRAVDEDLFGLWLGFPQQLVLVAAGIEGFRPNKVWPLSGAAGLWRTDGADGEEEASVSRSPW